MRIYFFLGKNLTREDWKHAIFAMEVIATGHGFDKEKFNTVKTFLKNRDDKLFTNDAKLIAFDCSNNRVRTLLNPDYEQSLLGNREAFFWHTEENGKWQCISPAGCEKLFIQGRKTYVDFS